MNPRPRECDLSAPVTAWLRAQGFEVWAEVRGVDLIGYRLADDTITTVELKRCLSHRLVEQARRPYYADLRFAACGGRPAPERVHECERASVGVLHVQGSAVRVLAIPPANRYARHDNFTRYRAKLVGVLGRLEPGGLGGVPCRRGEGPRQRVRRALIAYLAEHPRASWFDLFANVPNHYASAYSLRDVHALGIQGEGYNPPLRAGPTAPLFAHEPDLRGRWKEVYASVE